MGEVIYKPLIQDMTWSFSRLECFSSCKHRWYLKYIIGEKENDMFYASYGSFMHKLIERYYKGELKKEDMTSEFLLGFREKVKGLRPKAEIVEKYISLGISYLESFTPLPINVIAVEKRVEFSVENIPFVGYIDIVGEKNNDLYIIDNKSRDLKQRSGREKPTKNDLLLDEMEKQLYLYGKAVKDVYGKFPSYVGFNCFKNNTLIIEPFKEEKYKETVDWARETVTEIENTEDFDSSPEFFKCVYLCGVNDRCAEMEF